MLHLPSIHATLTSTIHATLTGEPVDGGLDERHREPGVVLGHLRCVTLRDVGGEPRLETRTEGQPVLGVCRLG